MSDATVLIADDDASDIERFKQIFAKANIVNPILAFESAEETIAYLSPEGRFADRERYPVPAILFLDLVMPGKGGLDVVRWIRRRAEAHFKTLAIVVMTGIGNVEEIRQAYQNGAHSFLIKPLNAEDIMNLLRGHVGIRMEPTPKGTVLHFDGHYFSRRVRG